jgi:hypothetical protein
MKQNEILKKKVWSLEKRHLLFRVGLYILALQLQGASLGTRDHSYTHLVVKGKRSTKWYCKVLNWRLRICLQSSKCASTLSLNLVQVKWSLCLLLLVIGIT